MPVTRRNLIELAAATPFLVKTPSLNSQPAADDSFQSAVQQSAGLLGLPGYVAGVVRDGKPAVVLTGGFADLESRTPMRRDNIFYLASLTKTFTAVMMMQYVQEKRISLDDYLLDYPFLSVGLSADRLTSPDVRLKHVISHTSEGKPGDHFVYNGNRYNFVYGVFERMSGNKVHYQASAQEFRQRIEQPLGLTSTLAGYPTDKSDRRIPRIATPYLLDPDHKTPTKDTGASGGTTLYPATGLLSSVDDLAKYMIALDENVLLSSESYAHLTAPFTLNDGRLSPYGLGWSTQKIAGHAVHWHYGYGDSYAALLVRIPQKKTSFIFLSNTGIVSAPFLLGYGNLLTSPFAVAFLDSALPGALTTADRDFSRMFVVRYMETSFGRNRGEAKNLLQKLTSTAPDRFQKSDRATISLLSDLCDPAFGAQMASLVEAYRQSGDFHPEISLAIADYYGKTGNPTIATAFLRQIADRPGYGEQKAARDACTRLGTKLLQTGQTEEGRKYLWMATLYAKTAGESIESQEKLVQRLKP